MAKLTKLSNISLAQGGRYYTTAPTIQFHGGFPDSSDHIKFGSNSLDAYNNHWSWYVDSTANSLDGFVAFWLWLDSGALPDSAGSNMKPLWEMGDNVGVGQDFRRRFGVDNLGRIKSTNKYTNPNSVFTWENQGSPSRLTEGQWNHIIFGFAGPNSGTATRRAEAAINGDRVYYTNSTAFAGVTSDSGVLFGSQLAGSYGTGSIVFDSPSGMYIDNLYIDSDDAGFTLNTEIAALYTNDSDGGNWFSSSLDIHQGFNNDSASATATISGGAVDTITLTDSGMNYISVPTIQFVGGSAIDSDYNIGDSIGQTIAGGVKMSGEIQRVVLDSSGDSSIHLFLSNVGADDGKFHTFTTDADVINNTLGVVTGLTVNAVSEINNLSATEQNDEFTKTYIDDFIDFSENNPFGDPENQ